MKHFEIEGQTISYTEIVQNEGPPEVITYRVLLTSELSHPMELSGSIESSPINNGDLSPNILRNGTGGISSGPLAACITPFTDQGEVLLALGVGLGLPAKKTVSNIGLNGPVLLSKEDLISIFSKSESLHLIFLEGESI